MFSIGKDIWDADHNEYWQLMLQSTFSYVQFYFSPCLERMLSYTQM